MAFSDVSAVTNHFVTANEGFTTTTSGSVSSGATTVGLNSVAGLTNGSVFVGVIEPGGTKEQVFTGTVDTSGSHITGVKWTRGTNVAHSTGVSVVDYDTGTAFNMMRKGILVSLDQDGTLKTGAVDTAGVLASNVVTTAKIADDAVTTAKLADDAVTPAKWTNSYAFIARCSSTFSTSAGAFAKVPFNTDVTDYGNNFNTSTTRYEAPVAGLYNFSSAVAIPTTASSTRWGLSFYVNGSEARKVTDSFHATATNSGAFGGSADIVLAAGDYVEVYLVCSGATTAGGTSAITTWFAGHLVSPQ